MLERVHEGQRQGKLELCSHPAEVSDVSAHIFFVCFFKAFRTVSLDTAMTK